LFMTRWAESREQNTTNRVATNHFHIEKPLTFQGRFKLSWGNGSMIYPGANLKQESFGFFADSKVARQGCRVNLGQKNSRRVFAVPRREPSFFVL